MDQASNDATLSTTLKARFEALRAAARRDPYPGIELRRSRLTKLEGLLRDNVEAFVAAISADFGNRSGDETRMCEFFPVFNELRHARRHLRGWMRPRRRATGMWFLPARSSVVSQPLGAVGIVAPWNYPLLLAVGPLSEALAAGNRVMIKMSEHAPRTASLLARLIAERFAADEVTVVEGDIPVAQAFVALPFDHLLFTGSTAVGASVMCAAGLNLTPVTLELGGKSPTIVAPDYPLAHALDRIFVGKLMNAGQTCLAPDYVLVPAGSEAAFVAEARRVCARFYPEMATTPDYATIVDERHYRRLCRLIDEAAQGGAEVIRLGPEMPEGTRRLAPHLLLGVRPQMQVMREEIFGPLLPVIAYRDLDEAIAFVNALPRALALYLFDRNPQRIERVMRETTTGGVTLNDTILHIAQNDLPFGGVGPSGMGRIHGRDGFDTFSHQKAVFHQSRFAGIGLLKPPYGRRFRAMVGLLLGRH